MDRADERTNRLDDRSKHSSSPTRYTSRQPATMAPRPTAHHSPCVPQDPTDARVANADWMAEFDGRAPILLDKTDPTETHPPEPTPVVRQKMDPTILARSMWEHRINIKHRSKRPRHLRMLQQLNNSITAELLAGARALSIADRHHFDLNLSDLLDKSTQYSTRGTGFSM